MRHRVKSVRLNRQKPALKAMLRSLVTALILHERIRTTEKRAKAIQPLIDRMMTVICKKNEREAIRDLKKILLQKEASIKCLSELKPRAEKRASGFTRIIPIGTRKGDSAPLVQIEFVI